MEAEAKHDFNTDASDELPFRKNTILKILNVEEDPNWYLAEQDGRRGLVPCNYIAMRPNPWFAQGCSRSRAEERLLEKDPHTGQYVQPDGAFFLRPSEAGGNGFSLSVKDGMKVLHFKVLQDDRGKYFIWMCRFDSVNQLIEYHKKTTISRDRLLTLVDPQPSKTFGNSGQSHSIQRVIARFDFEANDKEELSFRRGDVIEVLGREDENWWQGRLTKSDQVGLFPANYVDIIPPLTTSQ
uniref:Growth factor receptor-bound protein 2 n=1 Tax=Schistocephalus solidus TaxID=70667 RepID=A0A0X3P562_SCHSO